MMPLTGSPTSYRNSAELVTAVTVEGLFIFMSYSTVIDSPGFNTGRVIPNTGSAGAAAPFILTLPSTKLAPSGAWFIT